jgi:hypothetical protein
VTVAQLVKHSISDLMFEGLNPAIADTNRKLMKNQKQIKD